MDVLLAAGALVAGLVVLVYAADVFVGAAEGVALHLRWSPAVIGAVVVGFGTSLPELVTSVVAALAGEPDLAIGNAAGSNVANLLLILGGAALVAPIRGRAPGPGRDVLIAVVGGVLLLGVALDGELGWLDGGLLLVGIVASVSWQVAAARDTRLEVVTGTRLGPLTLRVGAGLLGVIAGAQLLVWGATTIATELGVPTIFVGSVLVAVGTSLPELATAIASARRGQTELLLGNLVGSNAFNAMAVVGAAATVGAIRGDQLVVEPAAMTVVVAAALVTAVVGVWIWRKPAVPRAAATVLLAIYAASVPLLLAVS